MISPGLVETESGYGTRVRVPRGSMLVCRPATAAERADPGLDLGEGEWVAVWCRCTRPVG